MSDHGIARDQLRAFIERIERLEEEKKAIANDIKDVYGEAKGAGFTPAVMREIVKIRKKDANERAEHEALLDLYLHALGMAPEPDGDDDGPAGGVKIIDRQDSDGNHLTVTVDRRIAEVLGRNDRAMAEASPRETISEEPEPCDCADRAPAGEDYICPKCDAEWPAEEEITEPQVAPAAQSPRLHEPVAQISRPGPDAGSSNGRTAEFDSANGGSNPSPATIVQFHREDTPEERCLRNRPNCRNPKACGSSVWNQHCYPCTKFMTGPEDAA